MSPPTEHTSWVWLSLVGYKRFGGDSVCLWIATGFVQSSDVADIVILYNNEKKSIFHQKKNELPVCRMTDQTSFLALKQFIRDIVAVVSTTRDIGHLFTSTPGAYALFISLTNGDIHDSVVTNLQHDEHDELAWEDGDFFHQKPHERDFHALYTTTNDFMQTQEFLDLQALAVTIVKSSTISVDFYQNEYIVVNEQLCIPSSNRLFELAFTHRPTHPLLLLGKSHQATPVRFDAYKVWFAATISADSVCILTKNGRTCTVSGMYHEKSISDLLETNNLEFVKELIAVSTFRVYKNSYVFVKLPHDFAAIAKRHKVNQWILDNQENVTFSDNDKTDKLFQEIFQFERHIHDMDTEITNKIGKCRTKRCHIDFNLRTIAKIIKQTHPSINRTMLAWYFRQCLDVIKKHNDATQPTGWVEHTRGNESNALAQRFVTPNTTMLTLRRYLLSQRRSLEHDLWARINQWEHHTTPETRLDSIVQGVMTKAPKMLYEFTTSAEENGELACRYFIDSYLATSFSRVGEDPHDIAYRTQLKHEAVGGLLAQWGKKTRIQRQFWFQLYLLFDTNSIVRGKAVGVWADIFGSTAIAYIRGLMHICNLDNRTILSNFLSTCYGFDVAKATRLCGEHFKKS